jgi:hypothetical protein
MSAERGSGAALTRAQWDTLRAVWWAKVEAGACGPIGPDGGCASALEAARADGWDIVAVSEAGEVLGWAEGAVYFIADDWHPHGVDVTREVLEIAADRTSRQDPDG